MIEEPYRWVEAIANRREYVEHQLATGSPITGLSFRDGILLLTLGRERQKVFEIYDRIAMGAIGHPGDIERLRMAAIELASTEGFTRSADDVSLRRLADYALSPTLKSAFEQVYGAPYLVRILFAELGRADAGDFFLRLDFDGAIHTNGGAFAHNFERFGVLSGTPVSTQKMENFLREREVGSGTLAEALKVALEAWVLGHLALSEEESTPEQLQEHRAEQLKTRRIEAAVLDRGASSPMTWRALSDAEARELLGS